MDHPIILRELDVCRVETVTPGIRRVVLTGAQLGAFTRDGFDCPPFRSEAPDDHVKILPPTADPFVLPTQDDGHLDWPEDPPATGRDYTVRSFDSVAGELVLDVVLGHDGPGARWADSVAVGDRLHLAGPRHSAEHPTDAAWYVLVGDAAALPAIAHFCDELTELDRVTVIAVGDGDHRTYPMAARHVTWIADGAPDEVMASVERTVRAVLAEHPDAFVWAGLEFQDARHLRAVLRDAGVPTANHHVTHYWRRPRAAADDDDGAIVAGVRAMADLIGPTVLRAAVAVGLPDALAAGADTPASAAARTGCDAGALAVVLGYLASRGLTRRLADGRYELTSSGEVLRRDYPAGLAGFLDPRGAHGHMATALPGLQHTLRTGGSAYAHVHGREFWRTMGDDASLGGSFDRQLADWATRWAPAVAGLDLWPPSSRVLDVGGGQGVLAAALAAAHPSLRIAVLELASTASRAVDEIAARQLADRVSVVIGDFFEALPRAERITLAQILHDWPDDAATRILERCADALEADGRLLVVERLPDREAVPSGHDAMSVLMLALFGAKERSRADYDTLLRGAGFEVVAVHDTGTPLAVLEARTSSPPT